jgi:hypothetical protein
MFSEGGIGEFIGYLEGLQAGVAGQHLDLVRSVYGDQWLEPYNPFSMPGR